MIDVVFRDHLRHFIADIASVSPSTTIIMHGYGHTVPTGKGVLNILGLLSFVGPWLLPALQRKGISGAIERDNCVQEMIDRYNTMLSSLPITHPKFVYVDLRPLIDKNQDWVNELHLRNSAYLRVADKIANIVNSL
jgi:hypothetical protein